MPACCSISTASDRPLMRAPVRYPSEMLIASTPRTFSSAGLCNRFLVLHAARRHYLDGDGETTSSERVREA